MSWLRTLRLFLFTFLVLGGGMGLSLAQSNTEPEVEPELSERVVEVTPFIADEKLYINADIAFELSDEIREAAFKGVPLHFTADVEIKSSRWWWFDKTEIKESQTWRVVYNALTRQWRVGAGDLLWPESSLSDALYPMRHIRHWALAYVIDLDPEQQYQGRVRLRLDTSLLTRPLQVDALDGRSWSLATPWKNFNFYVGELQP